MNKSRMKPANRVNQYLRPGLLLGALILVSGLAVAPGRAQSVPSLLNYQGVLRQGDGTPAPAGYKDIQFRIYDAATGGTLYWGRVHRVHLDDNGLFNVVLNEGGSPITAGNPKHTDLIDVFVSAGSENRYLELQVVGSTPILPRQRFVTTAYAFLAADVAQAKQNFTVQGQLTVQQGARVQSLTVDNDTTIGKNATINGSTTMKDALSIQGNTSLPTTTSGSLNIASGYPSPVLGRIFVGDGTGWRLNFSKRRDGVNTDFVTIEDSGAVGIGTDNPAKTLDVAGTVAISQSGSGSSGAVAITGDSEGASFWLNAGYDRGNPGSGWNKKVTIGQDGHFKNFAVQPFQVRRYDKVANFTDWDTGYSTSEWSAMVVGLHAYGDFNEDDSGELIHAYAYPSTTGKWFLNAGIRRDAISSLWVDVLFIRREWVDDNR